MGFLSEIFELIAADGSTRSVKGYKASKPKAGTSTYNHKGAGISKLPAKVDLRQHMTPVEDQGETNSCTANAAAGAFEYLFKRHNGVKKDVSRLYIYYNGRYMAEPDNIEDEGACISDIVDGLKEYGACMEKTWNFDPDYVNDEPEAEAYEEGGSFVVGHARLVEVELDAWKTALAAGNPIIFGLNLYNSFDKQRKPGLVTSPSKSEESRGSHAGHAMLCAGYSDSDEVFIVRNSWGKSWGDKGYCYIPYSYMMNSEHNDGDCWIIEGVEELPPDEENWSEDEESVLEEVSTILANMDEESYAEFLNDMGDIPFEQRLALLFLTAVGADGDTSDEEIEIIKQYLEPVIEATGGNRNAAGILRQARKFLDDEDILTESMDVIWNWFDYDVLASITNQIQEAAAADGLKKAERQFIDMLTEYWQSENEEEDEEEDEEE